MDTFDPLYEHACPRRPSRRSIAWVPAIAFLAALLSPRAARADFTDDLTSIVEQLIEDTVATQVVPNSAENYPVTCDLIPASIYALQAKRYNGFSTVVGHELADAAGLLVTLAIDEGHVSWLPTLSPALAFRPQTSNVLTVLLTPVGIKQLDGFTPNDTACTYGNAPANKVPPPVPAPTQSLATTVLQACATAQPSAQQDLACAAGLAVRDAAETNTTGLAADGQRALIAVAAYMVLNDATLAQMKILPSMGINTFADSARFIRQSLASPSTPVTCPASPAPGTPANAPPCDPAKAAQVSAVIQGLASQVATLSGSSNASLAQTIATVVTFAAGSTNLTAKLKVLGDAVIAGSAKALAVVADIQAKNYGAAAGDAFDTIEATVCPIKEQGSACQPLPVAVRTFLKAAAVYAIDSQSAGGASSSVAVDFRTAAVELIEEASGSGVHRRTFAFKENGSSQWPGFVIPDFALRGSLRPGFAGPSASGTSSSALMSYPSMDWPNARWFPKVSKTTAVWWGFNVSALDIFGPFVELAGRDGALGNDPHAASVFWLAFVVPRLEMEFAMPQLSRNLVIGFGGAARFYRAELTPPATAGGAVVASYCVLGQSGCQNGSFNPSDLEGTLFVKYVP